MQNVSYGQFILKIVGENKVVATDKSGNSRAVTVTINNAHSYDNDFYTTCNVCGEEQTITHAWQTQYSSDNANHWRECSVCQIKKDKAAHTADADYNYCTTAIICSVCDVVTTPAQSHDFSVALLHDENGH